MNLYELGLALKEARIRQLLTQSELASRSGVSLSTISGLERGNLPEIGTVKLLQLFEAVGLELQPRPAGQRRTLDDVNAENLQTSYPRQAVSGTNQKNYAKLSSGSGRLIAGNAVKRTQLTQADDRKDFAPARQRVRHAQKRDQTK